MKAGQRVRILVVDDDKDIQGFLRLALEGAGYSVECGDDGQQALQKAAVLRPDLVLLDVMMPVMDGWEVLRRLRSGGSPPPVVILSAFAERRRAIQEGATACLSKPFALRELLRVCEQVLAASGEG